MLSRDLYRIQPTDIIFLAEAPVGLRHGHDPIIIWTWATLVFVVMMAALPLVSGSPISSRRPLFICCTCVRLRLWAQCSKVKKIPCAAEKGRLTPSIIRQPTSLSQYVLFDASVVGLISCQPHHVGAHGVDVQRVHLGTTVPNKRFNLLSGD